MLKQGIRFINMSFCILNFLFYSIVLLAIEGHVLSNNHSQQVFIGEIVDCFL